MAFKPQNISDHLMSYEKCTLLVLLSHFSTSLVVVVVMGVVVVVK